MGKDEHRAGAVVGVVGLLYGIHSLLASFEFKALVRRLIGQRYDPGLYRFFFTLHSVVTLGVGVLWFRRQPDKPIYHLRWPWSLPGRVLQLVGIISILDVGRVVGVLRFFGISQALAALLRRSAPKTPIAQGPPMRSDGALSRRGLFGYTRHPDNLPALLIFAGFSRMTWNRLALLILTAVYSLLGSLHEDTRLQRAYGPAFEDYRRDVPFFIPRLWKP